jgi:hypothetical protein
MTELTTEERMLNGFLRVILDSELNAAERQAAATSLRSGRLVDCLLAVLEFSDEKRAEAASPPAQSGGVQVDAASIVPPKAAAKKSNAEILSPEELFTLLRKRKVSKAALTDVIQRLNSGVVLGVEDDASTREILNTFRKVASDTEWITLTRAIRGEIVNDSYLSRIMGR